MPTDDVTVPLIAPHTHAGRECAAGESITVPRRRLALLERWGVIERGAGQSAGQGGGGRKSRPRAAGAAPADPELPGADAEAGEAAQGTDDEEADDVEADGDD